MQSLKNIMVLLLCGCPLLPFSATFAVDSDCRPVYGHFDIVPVAAAECSSAVGICGTGSFHGSIRGSYFSPFTEILPTNDTPFTDTVLFTADTFVDNVRIDQYSGSLTFKEAGTFHLAGAGEFTEQFAIVEGSDDLADAHGILTAFGTYDAVNGGEGIYQGMVCVP